MKPAMLSDPMPADWFDNEDFLESRAFYEVMQAYRHCPIDAAQQFEHVKRMIREFYTKPDWEPVDAPEK